MDRDRAVKMSRDTRRGQIVQATMKILSAKGMSGLTTAALAREIGISEANLYRHFGSKEEILSATVEKIGEELLRNLENVSNTGVADSPLVKLRKAFMLHLDYIERNGGIPRLVFSEEIHAGNEELKRTLLNAIGAYAARLESVVSEGQKGGVIKRDLNPKAAALMLIGMVQVTAMRWSLSGFSFPLVDEGMKLWENFRTCVAT
ncbi:MAG: TetR/AcrR family transcriptional regulator [Nitrospirae bacterium]|nr:TetR/AcrR family transcriptional regulator [Nitrospirota bacterium]